MSMPDQQTPTIGDVRQAPVVDGGFECYRDSVLPTILSEADNTDRDVLDVIVVAQEGKHGGNYQHGIGINPLTGEAFMSVVDASLVPVESPLGERALSTEVQRATRGTVFGQSQLVGRLSLQPQFDTPVPTVTFTPREDGIDIRLTRSGAVKVVDENQKRGVESFVEAMEGTGMPKMKHGFGRYAKKFALGISDRVIDDLSDSVVPVSGRVTDPLSLTQSYLNLSLVVARERRDFDTLRYFLGIDEEALKPLIMARTLLDRTRTRPKPSNREMVLDFLDERATLADLRLLSIVCSDVLDPDLLRCQDPDIGVSVGQIATEVIDAYDELKSGVPVRRTKTSRINVNNPRIRRPGSSQRSVVEAAFDRMSNAAETAADISAAE